MLYSMKTTAATAAAPRVVDAHSLLHLRASQSRQKPAMRQTSSTVSPCLQNLTLRMAATAYGVSPSAPWPARGG